jgi:serine/threonine-protein kinase RsbW
MNSEPKDVTVADLHSAPEDHADPTVRVIKGFLNGERPPTGKVMIGTWTPISFAELRTLRASVRHALASQLMSAGEESEVVARRLAIVATELAANAMAHTGPPTTVRLFRTATTYIVDVADNNPWLVAPGAGERFARAGGLGLRMAHKLSLRMGWYTNAGIKHVWAEVATTTAASRRRPDPTALETASRRIGRCGRRPRRSAEM